MRHRRSRHKLNRSAPHRKAMGANLATALLTHGRIQTTLPKARLAREVAEKAITLGKDGSLHARRQAIALLRNKEVTYSLFDRIAPAFADVNGGYTRTLKLGPRPGDSAEMVLLELTVLPETDAEDAEEAASAPVVEEPVAEDEVAEEEVVEEADAEEEGSDEAEDEEPEAEEEPDADAEADAEDAADEDESEPVAEAAEDDADEAPAEDDSDAEEPDAEDVEPNADEAEDADEEGEKD